MNCFIRIITASFLFAAIAATASAAEPTAVRGSMDRQHITIGDRLTYDIALPLPAGATLGEPARPAELGLWAVKDMKTVADKKDPATRHLQYTLTTFTTGEVTIPELSLFYTDSGNNRQELKVSSASVTVDSVLAKAGMAAGIRDIKLPLALPVPLSVYLAWLAALAAIGAGVFFWYRAYRKRHAAAFPEVAVPAVPADQLALQELEKLKNAGLVQEGRIKEYYIALSEIIRTYIAAVYAMTTLDRTTAEIYQELRQKEPDKRRLSRLKDFFDECDLVKFAKYRPDEPLCLQDWDTARKIVEEH
jgi:hypothetical protein